MSFVNPAFLWALTALVLPVIVHLFSFRRTQRVYFSSNRFLRKVQQATASRQKLKHYLILISRLLFVFFLVMAFAQPFIPARHQVSDVKSVSVYIDNSLSMSVPAGESDRALDVAVQYTRELLEVFPPDTRYQLFTNDFSSFSHVQKTKTELMDLLSTIRLSPVSRSLFEVLKRMHQSGARGDYYLISDFQRSTTGQPDSLVLQDTTRHLYALIIPLQTFMNVYADTAWFDVPFITEGEQNTLHVRVRNSGKGEIEQLPVKFLLNNIQTGTATVAVPAEGSVRLSFTIPSGLPMRSRAEIRFSDFPVTFDNQLYVSLNRLNRIRVVEIRENTSSRYIEAVYGNEGIFFYRSYEPGKMDYAMLQQADLVVLNEVARPDPGLLNNLNIYLSNGGSMLVIPGRLPSRELLDLLNRMVPVKPVEEQEMIEIQLPDFRSPFFRNIVEESSNPLAMFRARRVLEWSDRSALLRFRNDRPWLSRFRQGNGYLYLLAAPLQDSYTDFGSHFLYLPLMYRMAVWGKKTEIRPYYNLAEGLVVLRPDSAVADVVRLAGDQEIVPDQRWSGNRIVMELPRTDMAPGFYYALHRADTLALLAFNPDPRESQLEQHTEASLRALLGLSDRLHFITGETAEDFGRTFRAAYFGKPLWSYALILALLFLLAEVLLIRFWK